MRLLALSLLLLWLRSCSAFARMAAPLELGLWRIASPEEVVRSRAVGLPGFRVLGAAPPYRTDDGFAVIRLVCTWWGGGQTVFMFTSRRDASHFLFVGRDGDYDSEGSALRLRPRAWWALARVEARGRPDGGYALRSVLTLRGRGGWRVWLWRVVVAPLAEAWNAAADGARRVGLVAAAEPQEDLDGRVHVAQYRRMVLFRRRVCD